VSSPARPRETINMLLLLDLPWQVALAAMTGCAADVVGGVTLHKVLQIGAPSKVRAVVAPTLPLLPSCLPQQACCPLAPAAPPPPPHPTPRWVTY
jgi:hypothetical protein